MRDEAVELNLPGSGASDGDDRPSTEHSEMGSPDGQSRWIFRASQSLHSSSLTWNYLSSFMGVQNGCNTAAPTLTFTL